MILKHIIRLLFVIFWAAIIYAFLLLPYAENYFFKSEKSLCIYTWADRIDESVLKDFEAKTGIKVYVNNYESNEELLTKLEKMPYVDCDIILPTGYIVDAMINAKLIKKIDRSKCNFLSRMYPEFLTTPYPDREEYTVPLYWDVLGVGYNNQKVHNRDISLSMIFDKEQVVGSSIGMIDDARQSIFLASLYLSYSLDTLSKDQLRVMHKLLGKQKEWVGAYSDSQQGYFIASKTFATVVSEREHICRQMLKHTFISFDIPQEGSMLSVDNVVISASTKKDDMVYELINYLYSHDVLKHNCQEFCILPAVQDVFEALDQKYIGVDGLKPGSEKFKKLTVFKNVLTSKEINDFWVRLKSM